MTVVTNIRRRKATTDIIWLVLGYKLFLGGLIFLGDKEDDESNDNLGAHNAKLKT